MYFPSEKKFLNLAGKGNLIPVYREILGDLETPVSAYFKVARNAKYSFLLESVEGEAKIARYSFLAKDPELIFKSKKDHAEIIKFHHGKPVKTKYKIKDTPLSLIRKIMETYNFVKVDGLPRFCGGMVGYLSYDVVRFFEKLPDTTRDDLKLPDALLVLAQNLIIFDHVNRKIKIVVCVKLNPKSSQRVKSQKYQQAVEAIDRLALELKKPLNGTVTKSSRHRAVKVSSNLTKSQFTHIVRATKQKIKSGEIIQAVLSQRFQVPLKIESIHIYRSLRALNPSPYMYFLNFDGIQIIGSSPELLIRCENGVVETRPIAGTRPRGIDSKQDQRYMRDLLKDPKERAEHIMLVDLGRNDLGRVCQKGSVRLSEFMEVEKYSHVMHIVSNVRGRLKKGNDIYDVLRVGFPAGTVSGAPKIRAMEIIEELEKSKRGPYAGCIAYFSFSKNLDSCITIRTIVARNKTAYIQAGAGIVADSNPEKEYHETLNKAKAQLMAIELAHNQHK